VGLMGVEISTLGDRPGGSRAVCGALIVLESSLKIPANVFSADSCVPPIGGMGDDADGSREQV